MQKNPYRLIVLSGNAPSDEARPYYDRAYHHWDSVWGATFRELEGKPHLPSDNFTRQHEIFALFDGLKCVSMVCFRHYDFNLSSPRKDSYFEPWTAEDLELLTKHGRNIIIASNLSVDPEYRGRTSAGVNLKDMTLGLTVRRMRELQVDAMTGTMRADKNTQHLLYQSGGEPIRKNVTFHNVPVDILALYPVAKPLTLVPDIEVIVEDLWQNRRGSGPLDFLIPSRDKKTKVS